KSSLPIIEEVTEKITKNSSHQSKDSKVLVPDYSPSISRNTINSSTPRSHLSNNSLSQFPDFSKLSVSGSSRSESSGDYSGTGFTPKSKSEKNFLVRGFEFFKNLGKSEEKE